MTESEKLCGTWKVIALEVEGRELSKEMFAGATITLDGDNFSTTSSQIKLRRTRS